jgi:sugar phosphate isomerase/epimerase
MDIALNTYSLRNEWKQMGDNPYPIIAAFCKDLGISRMELLEGHFKPENLSSLHKYLVDQGIKVFALAPHTKLLAKPNEVEKQIEDGKNYLKMAQSIGAEMIRVQVGDGPFPKIFPPMDDFEEEEWADYKDQISEAIEVTAAVTEPLIEFAEQVGVKIGIETHHSYSSNYLYMDAFNKRFPSKQIGWTFDIGNYENDEMRWKGLEVVKNRVMYLHAKAYAFDENGFEETLDFPRVAQTLHDAGFTGTWSIEFEGKMHGFLGVARSNELVKYSIAKATGSSYSMRINMPTGETLLNKYL